MLRMRVIVQYFYSPHTLVIPLEISELYNNKKWKEKKLKKSGYGRMVSLINVSTSFLQHSHIVAANCCFDIPKDYKQMKPNKMWNFYKENIMV